MTIYPLRVYSNFMKQILTLMALGLFILPVPALADHEEHDHTPAINEALADADIVVEPSESVIIVHGIVCSFCSQGVTKKLSKLDFIDPSKYTKGVKVEISDQRVTIAIKSGMEPDFDTIFASIKSGGYEPVKAYTDDGKIHLPESE